MLKSINVSPAERSKQKEKEMGLVRLQTSESPTKTVTKRDLGAEIMYQKPSEQHPLENCPVVDGGIETKGGLFPQSELLI